MIDVKLFSGQSPDLDLNYYPYAAQSDKVEAALTFLSIMRFFIQEVALFSES